MDTSEWAHREIIKRLRAMTTEERLRLTFRAIDMGRQIHVQALKRLADTKK
jgi:hypothetical protein